jgi:putative redox protein
MADLLESKVVLINNKVKFSGEAKTNPPITIDYTPPVGNGEGYTSLELLLISLATCSGTSVVSLLRKMRKDVSGLTVKAKGLRREVHPLSFQKICLEFIITSGDLEKPEVQRAIKLSEETYCPVWALLKNNVIIETEITINNCNDISDALPVSVK